MDANDVGRPGRDREHPAAGTSDKERRMRALERRGKALKAGHRVVLSGERERLVGEKAAKDLKGFLEAVCANAGGVERKPGFLVLLSRGPRSRTKRWAALP